MVSVQNSCLPALRKKGYLLPIPEIAPCIGEFLVLIHARKACNVLQVDTDSFFVFNSFLPVFSKFFKKAIHSVISYFSFKITNFCVIAALIRLRYYQANIITKIEIIILNFVRFWLKNSKNIIYYHCLLTNSYVKKMSINDFSSSNWIDALFLVKLPVISLT